ncbi:hypothetical protein M407DRAFT_27049 [Tulasnella calospora MUT 4182]|uniref:Uncharacterized protein n=1 Tax=Tulasnella calospora MUT 4182 TaxID=1051891 RepID=A0A0C3LPW1_9AGAM|nr:hypothetical protein M407DRAFT_27049 [Tulasnella calospora MUT 4182]
MQGPDPALDIIQNEGFFDENFTFNGTEGMAYEEFLQRIRRVAFSQGRSRDPAWMADLAALHFSGAALRWYESLDQDVQHDWDRLRQAVVGKYGDGNNETTVAPPVVERQNPDDYLLPARAEIANWSTPSPWSKIRFPRSEGEWLDEARKRKSKFGDRPGAIRWHLVETWEEIPGNAIPTGNEGGTQIFSIRAWKDPCLTIGKHVRGNFFWSSTRAWMPWWGREVACLGPFEILVGDQSAVRWVSPREAGRFYAVEGGFETGDPGALLIGQFNHMGMQVPGKVFSGGDEGYFGWWQAEFRNRDFRVLAWN